jgi:hypothetical protein
MEQDQHASLFSLSIEPVTKTHLNETAKWARFLAISGMVFLGLAVVGILFFAYYLNLVSPSIEGQYGSQGMLAGCWCRHSFVLYSSFGGLVFPAVVSIKICQ